MMMVTYEHVHDSNVLPKLVDDIIKPNGKMTAVIGKLFANDGAYDGNNVFGCLVNNGILPCIKVIKNAKVRLNKGHILKSISYNPEK
jgi:hypothetical protein